MAARRRPSIAAPTGTQARELARGIERAELGIDHQQRAVACASVLRSARVIMLRIETALRPHGLTTSGYEILGLLSVSEGQELAIADLRRQIFVHSASVTHSLNALQAAGWIERRPHPTDGRSAVVALTAAGTSTARAVYDLLGDIGFGFAELDDAQVAQVLHLTAAIGETEPPRA